MSVVRHSDSIANIPRSSRAVNTTRRAMYVPDGRSKLDVAVGRIVNELKVNYKRMLCHTNGFRWTYRSSRSGLDTDDDVWEDQSGKYWIGAEGHARVYFCRILRSRMVMVRVGGGWVELSKYAYSCILCSF